jgi:hypothetical protein
MNKEMSADLRKIMLSKDSRQDNTCNKHVLHGQAQLHQKCVPKKTQRTLVAPQQ